MNISSIQGCTNCGACFNECAIDAINIGDNGFFYYPKVDFKKCLNCGRCVNVCPINNYPIINHEPKVAYGLWHKDVSVVRNSSSGGSFYGLAKKLLEKGGAVYGAAYSEDCKSVVFTSTDCTDISLIMKSKYVESLVADTFRKVKEDLNKGREVLFCGAPCQVHGLTRFLKKEYDNLITCDFSCGGFPSHFLYNEYLKNLESKYKSKVKNVDFRPKTHGWERHAIAVEFENGKRYVKLSVLDDYFKAFLFGKYSVRKSCLDCKFGQHHTSDITLADFWKYKQLSSLNNEAGISLVLCNTAKGQKAFEDILGDYHWEMLDLEKASYNLKKNEVSEETLNKREAFLNDCKRLGVKKASKMHLKHSFYIRVRAVISNKLHRRK